jgi:hypothetical protein
MERSNVPFLLAVIRDKEDEPNPQKTCIMEKGGEGATRGKGLRLRLLIGGPKLSAGDTLRQQDLAMQYTRMWPHEYVSVSFFLVNLRKNFFSHLLKWWQRQCSYQDLNSNGELSNQWTYYCIMNPFASTFCHCMSLLDLFIFHIV